MFEIIGDLIPAHELEWSNSKIQILNSENELLASAKMHSRTIMGVTNIFVSDIHVHSGWPGSVCRLLFDSLLEIQGRQPESVMVSVDVDQHLIGEVVNYDGFRDMTQLTATAEYSEGKELVHRTHLRTMSTKTHTKLVKEWKKSQKLAS